MKLMFPNGQELEVANAGFTQETVDIIELMEEASACKELDKPFKRYGKLVRALRATLIDCLVRGGSTAEVADAAISSIPFGEEAMEFMQKARAAMGVD